jgi:hypothetical protein
MHCDRIDAVGKEEREYAVDGERTLMSLMTFRKDPRSHSSKEGYSRCRL